jgi:hypothetical protein
MGIREATKGSWGSRMGSAFLALYGLGGVHDLTPGRDLTPGPIGQ